MIRWTRPPLPPTDWSKLQAVFPTPRARRYLEGDLFGAPPTLTAQFSHLGQASGLKIYQFSPKPSYLTTYTVYPDTLYAAASSALLTNESDA